MTNKEKMIGWILEQNWYPHLARYGNGTPVCGAGYGIRACGHEIGRVIDRYWEEDLINVALFWSSTEEGAEFWSNINDIYNEKRRSICA